jgi:hypothetical protein
MRTEIIPGKPIYPIEFQRVTGLTIGTVVDMYNTIDRIPSNDWRISHDVENNQNPDVFENEIVQPWFNMIHHAVNGYWIAHHLQENKFSKTGNKDISIYKNVAANMVLVRKEYSNLSDSNILYCARKALYHLFSKQKQMDLKHEFHLPDTIDTIDITNITIAKSFIHSVYGYIITCPGNLLQYVKLFAKF